MTPGIYNLKIERGSNAPVTIRVKSKNLDGSLSVVDLTDYSIRLEITWRGGSIHKTSGAGLAVDLPTGSITWAPTEAETLSLPQGALAKYAYWLTTPGGTEEPYLRGYIIGDS